MEGAINLIIFLISFIYFVVPVASAWQATPGKRILGIHIVRKSGRKLGVGMAFGRFLAYYPSFLSFYIGFLMPLWTKEKRALHDMICGTRVVRGRL